MFYEAQMLLQWQLGEQWSKAVVLQQPPYPNPRISEGAPNDRRRMRLHKIHEKM
jgi:hypothetical protein